MHEHPTSASSWGTAMVKQMIDLEGVYTSKFDFCQLWMTTTGPDAGPDGRPALARKRTTVLTNSVNISEVLRHAQCTRLHRHVHLEGGKAKKCEVYPDKFV